MIRVKKYNKKIQPFDTAKIIDSIKAAAERANQDIPDAKIERIVTTMQNELTANGVELVTTDTIAESVEDALMRSAYKDVARAFITFRHDKQQEHVYNSDLIKAFKKKLSGVNIENSNANSDERSFSGRMNEASRVLLKDDALNTMSKKYKSNHVNNRVYTHDLDSYSSGQHNCFDRDTKFITSTGIKSFQNFIDGEKVVVLAGDGEWREATVHCYGQQKVQTVELESYNAPKDSQNIFIKCTKNHRWYLKDGSVTTALIVGDVLKQLPGSNPSAYWTVKSISEESEQSQLVWCVEEPVTNSFALAGGILTGNCLSIPFDNLLENGVAIKQTDLRQPKSIGTALQLVAVLMQVQSLQQFGGVSATHIDWTLVPYVRYSLIKNLAEVIAYDKEIDDDDIVKKDIQARILSICKVPFATLSKKQYDKELFKILSDNSLDFISMLDKISDEIMAQ